MRLDDLHLWFLANPAAPRYVGALKLVGAGKGVSLHYGPDWLASGFALSEDLPLIDTEFLPQGRLMADVPRVVGAVDDARPDRWGEKVIRFVDKPQRLSLMEYLYYAGDDRFGALGVSTSATEYVPRASGPLPRLEDAQQLSEVAAKIEASRWALAHGTLRAWRSRSMAVIFYRSGRTLSPGALSAHWSSDHAKARSGRNERVG